MKLKYSIYTNFAGIDWEQYWKDLTALDPDADADAVKAKEEPPVQAQPECTCPTLLFGHHPGCPMAKKEKN